MNYIVAATVLFLPLFLCSSAAGATPDEDIKRIHDAYEKINDIRGSFVQKSYIKDLKRTDTYKGVLFIKRPSRMRWEYKGEKSQEVIINNDRIIIYNKADKQAYKGVFNRQTYGQAPVALLSGFGNIKEEFSITSKDGRLVLIPRNPMGNIVSIEIETSAGDFPIKSFVINDKRSNRVAITLKDIEINTGIKDSAFDFSLPEGAGVYEYSP